MTSRAVPDQVRISSRTGCFSGFSLAGPLSRELLGSVCASNISNVAFPFLSVRELTICLVPVIAMRISFTGELGYELYMAPDYQRHFYDAILRVGQPLGLRHFGLRALNSLRMEKGYGGWGREYTQDYTPAEAGLQKLIRVDKPNFVGR